MVMSRSRPLRTSPMPVSWSATSDSRGFTTFSTYWVVATYKPTMRYNEHTQHSPRTLSSKGLCVPSEGTVSHSVR